MRPKLDSCWVISLLCATFGCGSDSGRVDVYPVTGKVLYKGQPIAGAEVVFYPTIQENGGIKVPGPVGTTDANGTFRLRSYEPDDGAPAGDFQVTVVWPTAAPPNATGVFSLRDQLNGRYANPKSSQLTAHIGKGDGELPPFELQ